MGTRGGVHGYKRRCTWIWEKAYMGTHVLRTKAVLG